MGAHSGKFGFGLFDNGCFQKNTNENFGVYALYSSDSISNGVCGAVNYNTYGSGFYSSHRIPIDTNKYYQFAVSFKTIARNYNNKLAGGHIGFRQYDANGSILRYGSDKSSSYSSLTLTREASPGDTVIYMDGPWSGTNNNTYISFYPPSHPQYNVANYWTQLWTRYDDQSYTDLGGGEYSVNLDAGLPDWGYDLPVGTPVQLRVGYSNPNTYTLGAPNYPEEWKTYVSSVLHGEIYSGGYFKNSVKEISFLNLRNYNIRNEKAGDGARYLIDNILFVECPNGVAWDPKLFKKDNVR